MADVLAPTSATNASRIVYRQALVRDAADQAEVFYHAVMQGAANHYTLAQRRAWANVLPREASAWAARHLLYSTLVATSDHRCVGFIELDGRNGRVETLYVWPSLSGRGIGTTLLIHAERLLLEDGHTAIEIEASAMLVDRLQRRHWQNLGEQMVERGGELLTRYRLRKQLNAVET
ncbi:MAG: GNAT family N-acetyltransferase [Halomonas sp.]|nr:GNAT family N-acetyltransferase [Halomonas sp.]TVM04997.1 MAG: GNAT family N-acetyltransferase [Halomonas sp.]